MVSTIFKCSKIENATYTDVCCWWDIYVNHACRKLMYMKEEATLKAINLDDLQAYEHKIFAPY